MTPTEPIRVSPAAPAPAPPPVGGRVGRYRLVGALGRGGMGAVYEAEDPTLNRRVALKVMLPEVAAADPRAKDRFLREARAQAAVEHDHVVPIFEVGEDAGTPFLTMPLLRGVTLAAALVANPRPPLRAAVRIARQIADGLAAAHVAGLIHRDIKPGNVWLEDPRMRVKVLDFGLARPAGPDPAEPLPPWPAPLPAGCGPDALTAAGAVLGTPYYMSPEQARGDPLDPRSDLFSLGIVLYEMTTGRPPFPAATTRQLFRDLAAAAPPPPAAVVPDLPPALSDLVMRMLAKAPDARPATAAAVAEELRAVEFGLAAALPNQSATFALPPPAGGPPDPWEDIATTQVEAAPPAPRPARVSRATWAAVAAGGAAAAGLLAAAAAGAFTGRGELLVEADPGVEVVVRRGETVVRDRTRDRRFELPAGEYAVEVADPRPGVTVSPPRVAVGRGGRGTVWVSAPKPPAPAAAPAADREREALVPLLPHLRELLVRTDGGADRFITPALPFPAEGFTVRALFFADTLPPNGVEALVLPAVAKMRGVSGLSGDGRLSAAALGKLAATPTAKTLTGLTFTLDPSPETLAALAGFGSLTQLRFDAAGPAAARLGLLAKLPPTLNDLWLDGPPSGADLPPAGREALAAAPVGSLGWRGGAGFDAAAAALVARMPRLKTLVVIDTPTDPAALAALGGVKGLESLKLDRAGVTDADVPGFARFPALVSLDLRGNAVSADAVVALRVARPGCRYHWDGGLFEPRPR